MALLRRLRKLFCGRSRLYFLCLLICCAVMFSFMTRMNDLDQTPTGHPVEAKAHIAKVQLPMQARFTKPNIISNRTTHSDCFFKPTFEENLEIMKKYNIGNVSKYLDVLGDNNTKPTNMTSFPVFVTAIGGGFLGVVQGLIKSLHEIVMKRYPDLRLIVYDLGLDENDLTILKKYCRCEVRPFPFDLLPAHVRTLRLYAWKPIIVQMLLMETGWVWWMDASARLTTGDLDRAVQYSADHGILFFTYSNVLSIAKHTVKETFDYFGEKSCRFRAYGETEAGFVLYHFDSVTKILVRTWAACALVEDCIAPPGSHGKLSCNPGNPADGNCHRFDQSVLSLLLRRLYHEQNDYPLVAPDQPLHQIKVIKRGDTVAYFPQS